MKINEKKILSTTNRAYLYIIGQIVIYGIGFITSPIYTRILQTEDYGKATLYFTTVNIVSVICGFMSYGTINNAISEYGEVELDKYCASMLGLTGVGLAIVLVIWQLSCENIASMLKIPVSLGRTIPFVAFATFCFNFLNKYYAASKRTYGYLILALINTISTFCISIFLIIQFPIELKYIGRIIGYAMVMVFIAGYVLIYFKKKAKGFVNLKYWWFCLRLSIPLIFYNLAGQIIGQSDRLMLNHYENSSAVGIYSFAHTIVTPLIAVWSGTNSAWVTQFYELMDKGEYYEIISESKKYLKFFTLVSIGFCLICPEVLYVLGTKEYYKGIIVLPIFVGMEYINFLCTFPINSEFYHKRTHLIFLTTIFSSFANVFLNIILIPQFSIMGAGIATISAYLLLLIFHMIVAKKACRFYFYNKDFFFNELCCVFGSIIFTYLFIGKLLIRWIVAVVVGVILLKKLKNNKGIF